MFTITGYETVNVFLSGHDTNTTPLADVVARAQISRTADGYELELRIGSDDTRSITCHSVTDAVLTAVTAVSEICFLERVVIVDAQHRRVVAEGLLEVGLEQVLAALSDLNFAHHTNLHQTAGVR